MKYLEICFVKHIQIESSSWPHGQTRGFIQKMMSHGNYEKRSLNMEYKGSIIYQIALALGDNKVSAIFNPDTGVLCLVKDKMNGAPV